MSIENILVESGIYTLTFETTFSSVLCVLLSLTLLFKKLYFFLFLKILLCYKLLPECVRCTV